MSVFLCCYFCSPIVCHQVSITPEVTSRGVNRAVMGELVTLYRNSHLGGRLPAYDGRKSLYTAGPLPFTSMTFEITLQDEEDRLGSGQGGQRYVIMLCLYLEHMQHFMLTAVILSVQGAREYLGW